jgi:flagellar biosynthetic protein FlhB
MSERTEAPTPRKLQEAREEGRIARSIELNTAVIMLVSAFLLRGPGGSLVQSLQQFITQLLVELPSSDISEAWLKEMFYDVVVQVLPSMGLIVVGILVTGVVVTLVQTGFLYNTKKRFDFNRINPLKGFQRMFSFSGVVELLKALLKLTLVTFVAYNFVKKNYAHLILLGQTDIMSALQQFSDLAIDLGIQIGGAYLILAMADYAYQRWDLMRNLRMSKQEIKEEYRRSEGDPMLKGRIRAQGRRLARSRMMANVHKATVIVTNPTHLALAIEYNADMQAPRLLAKGALKVAQRIVGIAREHDIPVVQNIPLAHAIYKTVEINQEITPDLYMAMAEVLAYVYKMRGISRAPKAVRQPSSA